MSYPDGRFTSDPAGLITRDQTRQLERTQAQPVLYGSGGGSPGEGAAYDWALSRWVPVQPALVSPNGARYAYTEFIPGEPVTVTLTPGGATWNGNHTRVRDVDVATGTERIVSQGSSYEAIGYGQKGIYLSLDPSGELWLLNPSGTLQQITTLHRAWVLGPDAAWALDVDLTGPPQVAERLLRLDLANGSSVVWLNRPVAALGIQGFDNLGHPLVTSSTAGFQEMLLLTGPNATRQLYATHQAFAFNQAPAADAHGIWFGTDDGVYLYSVAGGFTKVSSQSMGPGLRVAGTCR